VDMEASVCSLELQISDGFVELDVWQGIADGLVYPGALVSLLV
jgi:hypothetical protein